MPATQRGVYHNLKESKYTVSNSEIVYFFSSMVYLNKFMDQYKENRKVFKERLYKVFPQSPYNTDMLADAKLYEEIEKRGFHVWMKGVTICRNDLYLYALRKMIEKNTLEWSKIQKPKLGERKRIME